MISVAPAGVRSSSCALFPLCVGSSKVGRKKPTDRKALSVDTPLETILDGIFQVRRFVMMNDLNGSKHLCFRSRKSALEYCVISYLASCDASLSDR